MPFYYQSGEEIKTGDRVLNAGEPGQVDFIADSAIDPECWEVTKFGGGVMILEPKCYGRVFLPDPSDEEDLEFISRRAPYPQIRKRPRITGAKTKNRREATPTKSANLQNLPSKEAIPRPNTLNPLEPPTLPPKIRNFIAPGGEPLQKFIETVQ